MRQWWGHPLPACLVPSSSLSLADRLESIRKTKHKQMVKIIQANFIKFYGGPGVLLWVLQPSQPTLK